MLFFYISKIQIKRLSFLMIVSSVFELMFYVQSI